MFSENRPERPRTTDSDEEDEDCTSPLHKKFRSGANENFDSSNAQTPLEFLSLDSEGVVGTSKPVISWFSVASPSGEDLVFGSVKLEEFLSVQELSDLIAQEDVEEDTYYVDHNI
jgi:hypothetical protein